MVTSPPYLDIRHKGIVTSSSYLGIYDIDPDICNIDSGTYSSIRHKGIVTSDTRRKHMGIYQGNLSMVDSAASPELLSTYTPNDKEYTCCQ